MATYQLDSKPAQPPADSGEHRVIAHARAELDGFYVDMRHFAVSDPVEAFLRLAAMTARVSELRGQIVRHESRRLAAFRTRELDPFLEECDRQFKFLSRAQAVRQMEADLTRGL